MNQELYETGKPYVVSYINNKGETITKDFTPTEEMNIVQVINKIKDEYKDFYKLYSIIEDKVEEIKRKEDNESVLKESNVKEEIIYDEKGFKEYVENKLQPIKQYIKLIRTSKKNKGGQWGVYVYGKDIITSNDKVLNGLYYYIPYDNDKSFVNRNIDLTKKEIIHNYGGKEIKMKTETGLEQLAHDILKWYGNDMGTYFDEIQGNETEIYYNILSTLENKNKYDIIHFINDIKEDDENIESINIVNKLKKLIENNITYKKYKGKTEALHGYDVYRKFINEDGVKTDEYVMSFEDFDNAQKFADGLTIDESNKAWVQKTEAYTQNNELNESKNIEDVKEKIKEMIKAERSIYDLQEYIINQFEENNISEKEKEELIKFVQENSVYLCMDCGNEFEIDQATVTDTFGTPSCPYCSSGDVAGSTILEQDLSDNYLAKLYIYKEDVECDVDFEDYNLKLAFDDNGSAETGPIYEGEHLEGNIKDIYNYLEACGISKDDEDVEIVRLKLNENKKVTEANIPDHNGEQCSKCGYESKKDEYKLYEIKHLKENEDEVEDYGEYYVKEFNEDGTDMDTIGFDTQQEAIDYARQCLKQKPTWQFGVYETATDECLYLYDSKQESKKLKESYNVYTTDYNEDGTITKEFYMSFDTYKEAERARQGLQDEGMDAWIEELNENKKITEAYEVHNELNPKLWNNETKQLLPEVQETLEQTAQEFIDYIDIPLDVIDIEFIGSNASYNYNEQSDIDLHLIVNFDLNYVDNEILQALYNAKKNAFNEHYNIEIKGIPVELYIQDVNSGNASLAIYSVTNRKWIKEPEPIKYNLPNIETELRQRQDEIDKVIQGTSEKVVKDLLNDIYMDRKNGLAVDGEASKGNVIFKQLRNDGYLELLRQKYYDLRSQQLSINESKEIKTEDVDTNTFEPYIKSSNGNIIIVADKNSNFEEEAIMKIGANGQPLIEWQCFYFDNGQKVMSDKVAKDKQLQDKLYSRDFYNKANKVAFKYLYDLGIIQYNDEEFGGWIINK